jgi:hypothetical protein
MLEVKEENMHKLMTLDEKFEILDKANALRDAGDKEGGIRLTKTVPLPSYIAKVMKEKVGIEYLINSGWNLAEAEAEFGSDWLNR